MFYIIGLFSIISLLNIIIKKVKKYEELKVIKSGILFNLIVFLLEKNI